MIDNKQTLTDMKTFEIKSYFTADKEHGVTNTVTDKIEANSEEEAKEFHREEINIRFENNPFYGGVYRQIVK